MKSSTPSYPALRVEQRRRVLAATLLTAMAAAAQSAQAANTNHTLTSTGNNTLSTATWTGGAPTNLTIGDIAIYTTATTASNTTIDTNVTVGGFRTNNTGVWTLSAGAGTLTLDGTGLTSANSTFGNAGVAFLANTSTAAGGLTVNSNLTLANSNLDIGTTNSGSVIIGGNITASSAQTISFRANGAGAITDSGNIGASGSNLAIQNVGTAAGGVTLSGNLGPSVTSVTQNSSTSALTLGGANTYSGPTNVTLGTLNVSGSINSSSALTLGGGLGAATLNYNATAGSTQTFASTTLNTGFSTITNGTANNTLNLGAITRNAGSILNITSVTGVGTTNTSSAVDSTGILGTAITTGTGTGLRYAAGGNSSAITAYTGTSVGAAASVTDTTGAVNYDLTGGGSTFGAGVSFNTLRYSSGGTTIAGNFTANGLMNAGTGAVTYSGNVTIGANKELVVVGNTQGTNFSGVIANNGGGNSSLTYGGPGAGTLTLSGVNTYTGATTIGQGSFTISGAGQLNSGNYAGNIFQAGGNFTYGSSANQTLSGAIGGAGTVVKTGAGTLTLSGANTYAGGTRANSGTLILSGSHTKASGSGDFLSVNNVGAQNAVLKITAGSQVFTDFNIAEVTNSRAAVYQTGGDFSTGTAGGIGIKIGSGATSYGYYNLSGGTVTLPQALDFQVGGGSGATGVMDVSGGSVTTASWLVLGRNGAGNGLLNVTGGSVTSQSNNIGLNWANASGSISILNVGGGSGAASVTGVSNAANFLDVSQTGTAGATGVVNVLSNGTLTVAQVKASGAGSNAYFNFNGGTLKATAANAGAAFMTSANVDAVTVYSGGGTIDNNGTSITVGNVLGAATGNGVTSIAVSNAGSGYIGAPLVTITGGTGNTATGYAVMEDDGTGNGTYKIKNIVITSGGTYTADPTTVTLTGGGASTAASGFTISTAANTSGGMTFSGNGTTTLSATNTYTGGTTITSGTLALGHATNTLADTGAVNVNGGTLSLGANSDTVGAVTLTSGNITSTTGTLTGSSYTVQSGTVSAKLGGSAALTKSGNGTVTLNGVNSYSGGTTISGGTLALGATGSIVGSINLGTSGSQGTLDLTSKGSSFNLPGSLSGYGSINIGAGKTVNLVSGAFTPGNSPGIVSVTGNLAFGDITTTMEVFSRNGGSPVAGTHFDQVIVSGTVSFGGDLAVDTTGLSGLANGDSFTLFSAGSYAGDFNTMSIGGAYMASMTYNAGTDSWSGVDSLNGVTFTFNEGNGVLSITAVPEPSSFAALAGLAGLGFAASRRRRRVSI